MNPTHTISLRGVEFSRMHDYMGLWAMEASRFWGMFHHVQAMDLPQHVQDSRERQQPAPRADATDFETIPTASGLSIAVLSLSGTLMKHASSLDGATGTVGLRQQIRSATRNPNIGGLLLIIDSPGGTVAGTSELAQEITDAAAVMPVTAFIEDLCASAAYWAASQATTIVANDRTALVGSIGTILGLYDYSKMAEKQGIEALAFASGDLKSAGFPGAPITPKQRAYFQNLTKDIQTSFSAGVSNGRGMTPDQVSALATGGVWLADQALELDLIDSIDSLENTINQLAQDIASNSGASTSAAANQARSRTMAGKAKQETAVDPIKPKAEQTVQEPKEDIKPNEVVKDEPVGEEIKKTPTQGTEVSPQEKPEASATVRAPEASVGIDPLAQAHQAIGKLTAQMETLTATAKVSADRVTQLEAVVKELRGEQSPAAMNDPAPEKGKPRGSGMDASSFKIHGAK